MQSDWDPDISKVGCAYFGIFCICNLWHILHIYAYFIHILVCVCVYTYLLKGHAQGTPAYLCMFLQICWILFAYFDLCFFLHVYSIFILAHIWHILHFIAYNCIIIHTYQNFENSYLCCVLCRFIYLCILFVYFCR